MSRLRRLRWWIVNQRDLTRMLDDAHAALRTCHATNVHLSADVARLRSALREPVECDQ